jgi:hypothetical protein
VHNNLRVSGNDFTQQRFAMSGPLQCSNVGNVGVLAVAATKERRLQQLRDAGQKSRAKKKANYTALQAANEQMLSQKAALEAKLQAMHEQHTLEASIREEKLAEQTAQIAQLTKQV